MGDCASHSILVSVSDIIIDSNMRSSPMNLNSASFASNDITLARVSTACNISVFVISRLGSECLSPLII
jgi:hypothetical protein